MTSPFTRAGSIRHIEVLRPGGPDEMHLTDGPVPALGRDDVRIHVEAVGINRADVLQREGRYAPPSTASPILGLEVAGYVAAAGERAAMVWNIGEEVCALVDGGGYATECVAPSVQCLPIPDGFSMVQAAALPEALFTVWYNVFQRCRLSAGETLLVHGGTSGIGVIAIQMARAIGAKVFATAGSPDKCAVCLRLGAEVAIDYHEADFAGVVLDRTKGHGVDVILDMVGGDYFERNLRALAMEGRLVNIAYMNGSRVSVDLSPIMQKRLTITGSTMRRLPPQEKAVIAQELMLRVWSLLERGLIIPVIDSTYTLAHAADAHRRMEGPHIGKIVLTN
ncbi:MAG TPA: NAD(P)H-quinone oxidoreductase [Gemmatimonadaceae bacterium]